METAETYHQRRAREQRARAEASTDARHRAIHEQLAALHDKAALNGGYDPEFAR